MSKEEYEKKKKEDREALIQAIHNAHEAGRERSGFLLDENRLSVSDGDWVKCHDNDYRPTIVKRCEDDGSLYITTYHATLDLKDCKPFTKCEPCKSEKCCVNYGDVECTYQESCE